MTCRETREDLELYSAGGGGPERRREIERHVQECLDCSRELESSNHFVHWLDEEIKVLAPSLEPSTPQEPRRWFGWSVPRLGWVAVQAALLVIVVVLYLYSRLPSTPEPWPGPQLSADITHDRIALRWTRSARAAEGYRILRGIDEKNFTEIARVGADIHTYTDSGLVADKTYHYRVQAFKEKAFSDVSNMASAKIGSSQMVNMSTRGYTGTGDNHIIAGFIIAGAKPKKMLIRALGPSLADRKLTGTLANPTLRLFFANRLVAQNDDWQTYDPLGEKKGYACGKPDDIRKTPYAPSGTGHERESALLITLPPGAYTAMVEGTNGTTGVAMVEAFEVE